MTIMLHKDTDITISYTTLNFGKLVLDIDKSCAQDIIKSIIEEVGLLPIINELEPKEDLEILEAFDFQDIMNHYGVIQVLEWAEANK